MTQHPSAPDPAGSPTEPLPPLDSAKNPTRPLPRPNGFFTWLRSLGIVRGEDDRWLGGVCAGIAARTGLDPVLVRGLFIVLGLFGGGLLLYGLAWAFLPEPDGRIHAEEALHGTWTSGTTGALAACILGGGSPSIFWASDGLLGGFFWTLFWVGGLGLLVYWLFTRTGRGAAASTPGTAASAPYTSPTYAAQKDTAQMPDTAQKDTAQMPAGSSVRPAAVPPRRPRTTPGAAEAALVLGAVLLTIGVVLTLDYASVLDIGTPVAVALAAGAAVNGLGIVILGSLGRSSGVLGLTAVAALVGAGVTGTNMGTFDTVVVANDADWSPTSSSPATGGYTLAAADGHLDLRYLAGETDPSVEVPINLAASDLTVLVPDDVPVLVRADMLAGSVQIDDGVTLTESGGVWKTANERMNDTAGEPLVVRIKGVASNVLVTVNESDLNR